MLREMLHAFTQYKILTIIFLLALALTILMIARAARAVRRHNMERDKTIARFQEEERLRKAFADLTPERIQNADSSELLHGIALIIQKELEEQSDMNAFFVTMPQAKRFVYALNYLFCENISSLSEFFHTYGQPLTGTALDAAEHFFPQSAFQIFQESYKMFDDSDETTSCTKDAIRKTDEAFSKENKNEILESVRSYILQNIHEF